jgi:hypothetical protein
MHVHLRLSTLAQALGGVTFLSPSIKELPMTIEHLK